jgi:hypothetical protein
MTAIEQAVVHRNSLETRLTRRPSLNHRFRSLGGGSAPKADKFRVLGLVMRRQFLPQAAQ